MAKRPTGAIYLALIAGAFALLSILSSIGAGGTADTAASDKFEYWGDAFLALAVLSLVGAFVAATLRLADMIEDARD